MRDGSDQTRTYPQERRGDRYTKIEKYLSQVISMKVTYRNSIILRYGRVEIHSRALWIQIIIQTTNATHMHQNLEHQTHPSIHPYPSISKDSTRNNGQTPTKNPIRGQPRSKRSKHRPATPSPPSSATTQPTRTQSMFRNHEFRFRYVNS